MAKTTADFRYLAANVANSDRPEYAKHFRDAADVIDELARHIDGSVRVADEALRDAAKFRAALEQIAKGEGEYSRDPLTHASNTIESMKAIAAEALGLAKGVAE